jgi:hypothetical protein
VRSFVRRLRELAVFRVWWSAVCGVGREIASGSGRNLVVARSAILRSSRNIAVVGDDRQISWTKFCWHPKWHMG